MSLAAFVVEDGTGLPTATSYISTDYANTYIESFVTAANAATWAGLEVNQMQAFLMQATQSIDLLFGQDFYGIVQTQNGPPQNLQNLLWPRFVMVINKIQIINSGGLPVQLQKAVAEVASMAMAGVDIFPQPNTLRFVKSQTEKVGSLEESTVYTRSPKAQKYTGFWKVEKLLKPLLRPSDQPSFLAL